MSTIPRRTFDGRPPVLLGEPATQDTFPELVGESAAMQRLRLQIEHIGPHFRTLLIQGETGTGKEVVARALHARSPGARRPFVVCYGASLTEAAEGDCGMNASPPQWIFTGDVGTIYVDGVDTLSFREQERLLEILKRMEMERRAHARIIASTSEGLAGVVSAGGFRTDLYRRLATVEILLEPLCNRIEDVAALAKQILNRLTGDYGRGKITIHSTALRLLQEHSWPGNIRELENVLRNGVLRCEKDVLCETHLVPFIGSLPCRQSTNASRVERLEEIVDKHVRNVLHLCSGNKVRAAEMLGISRSTLYRMLESMEERDG